ncbi:hypothetical protein Tco_0964014, partial [Tanacetum coccineum]
MTMRTKKNIDTLSIDDLYNNLSVFEQDIQKTSFSSLTYDNVAFPSQAKASSSKHKPSHNSGSYSSYNTSSSKTTTTATPGLADEVIHSFLDINWQIAMTAIKIKKFYKKTGRRPRVDGKMHAAFDKRKVECFNCHNTGHFAREYKFKGPKEGSRQEAGRGQDFKPVRIEKEALMTIDKDSYNALQAKYDELQSEFGTQEAAFKSTRVVHANVRQATPAWTNSNRVNKANQFTPRSLQLNNIKPNQFKSAGRVNANTGHGNVSSVSFAGTQFKSGNSRFNSGRMYVNSGTPNKSGGSRVNTGKQNVNTAKVNRPVLSNQTSQENLKSPKKCFSKQSSPVNRPFTRNTAYKSNIYADKGKMGTAVKTSAGCVW